MEDVHNTLSSVPTVTIKTRTNQPLFKEKTVECNELMNQ